MFSPSSGIVVPTDAVITGQEIDAVVNGPNYSKAFRLILAPALPSSKSSSTDSSAPSSGTSSAATQPREYSYRPHLEKVRAILDKELEANLNAQRQRTEARIEAYKSQQQFALQQSITDTRREKDSLWLKIQECVAAPPPPPTSIPTSGTGEPLNAIARPDGSVDIDGGQYSFDMPNTLPIRLTSASRVEGAHSAFLDRRKASVPDVAMSLQFREFDQRMSSNSLRRQSIVPAQAEEIEATKITAELTSTNTAANAAASSVAFDQPSSSTSNSGTSSPTGKSKKRVTINDAIKRVSIVEPEKIDYADIEDDEDVDEDEGVVFDLDEELGLDNDGQRDDGHDDDFSDDEVGKDGDEDESTATNGNGITINHSYSRSAPKSGMVVGSLRASYLRRQRGLERQRQSLNEEILEFDEDEDEDEDEDDDAGTNNTLAAAFLGTSLPIQIQPRLASVAAPLPARTSALATSLAMPPGSTPAAAMLQRRLSRAYGSDVLSDNRESGLSNNAARSLTSPYTDGFSSLVPPFAGATAGSVILDPLMLLEEEHDNDDHNERYPKHKLQFSSINHRRDLEKSQQARELDAGSFSQSNNSGGATALVTQQPDFEPPHMFSARTYVGSTPWEMPTRITVKSGGLQREGAHLDKEIALEMAKELELERQEMERTSGVLKPSEGQKDESDAVPRQHPLSTAKAQGAEEGADS
ncbi:hypothetical protein BGZ99_009157 [Dissophora globulifera]|uniref:Uncharacterized protein n=1 Tax=Dissophora globulifera TaxID=979702 RepID=A0A9P6R6I7_9FUNG|nr:hypothetical protein BGZ99_009157 [Dissophora globulifera]